MLDFSATFFITIINITVLYLILRLILFKPVTKFMDERARQIQESFEQSEKDKNQAKTLVAKYEAQLRTAEAETEAMVRSAREHAYQEAEKIIAESRASAQEMLENARKQLEMEHRAALALFRGEAAALVVEAAGSLVGRDINTEDNRRYADMLLREIVPSPDAAPGVLPRENEGKN